MDVNQVYDLIKFIANKNQQGYINPSQFNLIINQAQNSYTSFLLGSFQQYMPGRPMARVELGNNSIVRQRLAPIIKSATLTIDGTGFSPYPSDYVQVDAIRTNTLQRIRFVQQDSLYSYYNSVIDPVADNPIYLLEDTGLRFYPATLGSAKLSYVSDPVDIVWAYTLDANGRPVYDSANSVDPVWHVTSILEIVTRALAMIGINLQAGAVSQYAQEIKTNGQ
jgi:hypothetical protein